MPFLFVSVALAAEPLLLPLTADAVVGDHLGRVALSGDAGTLGGVGGGLRGEVAIVSRVAVSVDASVQVGSDDREPEDAVAVGAEVRGELLDETTAPIGLGAAVRYDKMGFDGVDAELEAQAIATRTFGHTRALLTVAGGTDVGEDEGDVEAGLAVLQSIGQLVRVGVDTRGRVAVGDAEAEDEEELEERRGWDLRAGAVVTVGNERVGGYAFGGVTAIGGEAAVAVGPMGSVGVQVTF